MVLCLDRRWRLRRLRLFVVLALGFAIPMAVAGQPPHQDAELAMDLATEPISHDGLRWWELDHAVDGDRLYLRAFDHTTGDELWTSDGTPAGTHLVLDICPGACDSRPTGLTRVGDKVFFLAEDGVLGLEPWVSDGTPQGTFPLADTVPGADGCNTSSRLTADDGERFFFTCGTAERIELWVSDGSRAGTRAVTQLCGPDVAATCDLRNGPYPYMVRGASGRIYYVLWMRESFGPIHHELWTSDGTAAGTTRLHDDCSPCTLGGAVGKRMTIRIYEGPINLWVSDGTVEGTGPLLGLCPDGACPYVVDTPFRWRSHEYLMVLRQPGDPGWILYRTDGTDTGTVPVFDLAQLGLGESSLRAVGRDVLYFGATTVGGAELWKLEASGATTRVYSSPGGLLAPSATIGDGLLFTTTRTWADAQLWLSDGTAEGLRFVQDISRVRQPELVSGSTSPVLGIRDVIAAANLAYFRAFDDDAGWELWSSDGTLVGTRRLADLGVDISSDPGPLAALDGRVVFDVRRAEVDGRLWVSGGQPENTLPLFTGPDSVGHFAAFGGGLLVAGARVYPGTRGLWWTDGSSAGTDVLHPDLHGVHDFVRLADRLLFSAYGSDGQELWAMPTNAAGAPEQVLDISPGIEPSVILPPSIPNSASPRELTVLGSSTLFVAGDLPFGDNSELWRTDGTAGGTESVAEIFPGECPGWFGLDFCGSQPSDLHPLDGVVYCAADDGQAGRELWRTDGTAEGTTLVADLVPGPEGGSPHGLFDLRGRLLFFAVASGRVALWSSDGTAAGTRVLHPLKHEGQASTRVTDLQVVADHAFFSVANGATGSELWVTDGTRVGTHLVADLRPGPLGSYPSSLLPLGRNLLFAASAHTSGRELWITDGRTEGTRLFADVAPGSASSNPALPTLAGDRLFFVADHAGTGRELWLLAGVAMLFRDGFESGDTTAWSSTFRMGTRPSFRRP